MRIYQLDRNLICYCKHSWNEHHHCVVMNPEYFDYPLTIQGCIAQECEHDQVNGGYFVPREKACKCNSFRPRAVYVQKLVEEWRKKHPRS